MHWQRLQARVEKQSLNQIESALELAGASAISLLDAQDQPLLEPAPGTTPLWDYLLIEALFPAHSKLEPFTQMLRQLGAESISVERLDEKDWVAHSEALDQPLQFGKHLWIMPERFQRTPTTIEDIHRVEVFMVPGLGFGSGLHPTTAMCLEWLDGHPPSNQRLLDFGCGSGILGIAAVKLGARAVSMVDIDPQAITASQRNSGHNQVQEQVWVGTPGDLAEANFDILVANILANPLLGLAERFAQLVARGGDVLLTGLLDAQAELIIDTYEPWFSDWSAAHLDGWLRLHGKRSSHS
jgi:ribosomal protein L11 methyltransferase